MERKLIVFALAAALFVFGPPASAQDASGKAAGSGGSGTAVPKKAAPGDEAGKKAANSKGEKEVSGGEIEKLVADLGDDDFNLREKAYKALKRIGEPARPWLKKALDSDDPEVRWRASRLLCYLDENKVEAGREGKEGWKILKAPRKERPFGNLGFGGDFGKDLSKRFNRLFSELFGGELKPFHPFRFRFFDRDFSKDLPGDIEDLLKEFDRETGRLDVHIEGGGAARYEFHRKEGDESVDFSLEVAPDGKVEATVTRRDEKGDTEKKTYSADSLEAFKKNYPGVVKEFRLDGFRVSIDLPGSPGRKRLGGLGFRMDRAPFGFARKFQPKVLGIYIEEPGPALRAQLGLDEGSGVVVTGVAPGSFAEKVGIRKMDVLVSIDGKRVGSAGDIRDVIGGVKEGETVNVALFRKGERLELEGKYSMAH